MKNIGRFLIAFIITCSFTLAPMRTEAAEIPPRVKAFLMVSGYGAAGGALLGLASMAFGQSSRAVAQGASLGLYAGILFGTYVIVTHNNKRSGKYDTNTPYKEDGGEGEDYEDGSEEGGGGYFDSYVPDVRQNPFQVAANYKALQDKTVSRIPPLQITVFHAEF